MSDATIENRLAEALCKAEDGGLGGVCGNHLRVARLALAHLADAGLLLPPGGEVREEHRCAAGVHNHRCPDTTHVRTIHIGPFRSVSPEGAPDGQG
jgi:hypothetical protein